MEAAARAGRVLDLVAEVLHDPRASAFHAPLVSLLGDRLGPTSLKLMGRYGIPLGTDLSVAMLESVKELGWEPAENPVEGLQALTSRRAGFENSLDDLQAKVDQLRRTAQIRRAGHAIGTGVLISNDLLLTAAHVLDPEQWPPRNTAEVVAVFDFNGSSQGSQAETGTPVRVIEYVCASLPTSAEVAGKAQFDWDAPKTALDFAVVRLARSISLEPEGSPRGHYPLDASQYDFSQAPLLTIVQHPLGQLQTTSYVLNPPTTNAHNTRIRYQANTLEGSSGSPVVDVKGRLVALHHYSTETRNQAVPLPVIAETLLEGPQAALFGAADAVPPPAAGPGPAAPPPAAGQPEPPSSGDKDERFDPFSARIISGWPFVDRKPLRDQLRQMAARHGPRYLAIGGGSGSGKSHSYQLVSYVASESGSSKELKRAAAGGLRAHRIDLRRFRDYRATERQAAVARAILECLDIPGTDDLAQDARMVTKVETELTRLMRHTDKQWWLFFDSVDDTAALEQDGTAELLRAVIGVANDSQHPLRIVLGGREAWELSHMSTDLPYFEEDEAERLLPQHAIEWVRERAKGAGRTVTLDDDGIAGELNQLISQRRAARGVPQNDIDAELAEFTTNGLLPRAVAPLLEKLMETVSVE